MSYDSIPAIRALPKKERKEAYRRAHEELRESSPGYRRQYARYTWAMFIIAAIGLVPAPFAFANPGLHLFVRVWNIAAAIVCLFLAGQQQKLRLARVSEFLSNK